ncbi:hypothetical protein SAMN05421664_1734 [Chryseobacterium soldanellicola]|uniref:Uncharacterized protein n=1 Tax=Chryseobacterium soldanellicola TaxID=311333 RepID=A0A1H1B661_9FLAO|nr:hypothetical protein [Chryseobacterium soldanellicola]SDQ47419.1 hypothetical protein SAMN05421664_1734 [Chryseobacterium soldanellicola]
MKKLLLGAFLIAGTTLAFAKDNVKSTTSNLKIEKTVSLEKVTPSSDKEVASVKRICGQLVYSEHTVDHVDMYGNVYTETVGTYTHYTTWC